MDKEKLIKLDQDEKYISGIYNYCDRWCERCPQTSRCLNYHIGEEEFSDPETRDINNEAFWKKMSEMMLSTPEMLNDMMAREYSNMVKEWMDGAEELFAPSGHEILASDVVNIEAGSKNDAVDVILWYQHQIFVKLMKAVFGSIEESDDDKDDRYAKDSDGSAKVALIGIDRSIVAWGNINEIFPEFYADNTKKILNHLEQLKRKVEKTFPKACQFIRPGFDNIDFNC